MPIATEEKDTRGILLAALGSLLPGLSAEPRDGGSIHWVERDRENLPGLDFNRELVPPGTDPAAVGGCVRIMCDHDFWEVANLPWSFSALDCPDIVRCLWPDLPRAVFRPDSGDYWWKAVADQNLEVPGEPFEVWLFGGGEGDVQRVGTYPTAGEAARSAGGIRCSTDRDEGPHYEIREWKDGIRTAGERMAVENVVRTPPRVRTGWPWEERA